MSLPQANSWSDLCVTSQLAFRAACNSALDPSRRPVKRRVIERLSNSSEARDLFERLWQSTTNSVPGSRSEIFFKLLAGDILWQTKVAEEVARENSWKDLSNIKFFKDKFRDWVSSLLEKLGSKEHPAARALTAATLGFSLVVAVKLVSPPDTLTIPVRVAASYDSKGEPISIKFGGDSVKVNLAPVTDDATKTQVPIQLQIIPDKTPVHVNVVSDGNLGGKSVDALAVMTKKLDSSNVALRNAAANLSSIAQQPIHSDLTNLRAGLEGVSRDVSLTTARLDDVNRRLAEIKSSYEAQSKEEVSTSMNEVQDIDQRLKILARASANQRGTFEMTFLENTARPVFLPHFDPASGQESSKAVVINVHDIRGVGKSKIANIGHESEGSSDPAIGSAGALQAYHEGERLPFDSEPWSITVASIEKHWYGKGSVILRFTPESSAIPRSDLTRAEIAKK
jgi:hypothetical protein